MPRLTIDAHTLHMAQVMDEAARRVRECRPTRLCVWCDEPVAEHRVYPACEGCREYRQVVTP